MKADCCHLRLGQKVALEHTSKTTCKGQLACTFCACVRGNNSPYQQGAVVCIFHSKMEIETRTAAIHTGAGHIIRISSKSWFISLIPLKKWNLYNVYIHSTQTDIFQVFISFNFDDYNWQLMKTPNSVSQKIRILWKGSILKTPGATL